MHSLTVPPQLLSDHWFSSYRIPRRHLFAGWLGWRRPDDIVPHCAVQLQSQDQYFTCVLLDIWWHSGECGESGIDSGKWQTHGHI
jgi:hypothetical protein